MEPLAPDRKGRGGKNVNQTLDLGFENDIDGGFIATKPS